MPPGSGRGNARPSGARKSGPEPRDATVERREARVPVKRRAGAFAKVPRMPAPFRRSAPSRGEGREMNGGPHAEQTTGAMNHAGLASEVTRFKEDCLTTDRANFGFGTPAVPHGGATKGGLTGVLPYGLF